MAVPHHLVGDGAGFGDIHVVGRIFQVGQGDGSIVGRILSQQDAQRRQVLGGGGVYRHIGMAAAGGPDTERHGERKYATGAEFTLHPNAAAHQFHKLLADRQSQAGAAEAAGGGRIGLRKPFEYLGQFAFRYADAGV